MVESWLVFLIVAVCVYLILPFIIFILDVIFVICLRLTKPPKGSTNLPHTLKPPTQQKEKGVNIPNNIAPEIYIALSLKQQLKNICSAKFVYDYIRCCYGYSEGKTEIIIYSFINNCLDYLPGFHAPDSSTEKSGNQPKGNFTFGIMVFGIAKS